MGEITSMDLFLGNPLVLWVQSFNTTNEPLDFEDFCDGVFLNDVMQQIDPRPSSHEINRSAKDFNAVLQNWEILMSNIKSFYQEYLQQLITMKLPNLVTIVREPDKESTVKELHKVLLLLLGCAVQCERKEDYVSAIKQLDIGTQQELVEYIKEITDNSISVFANDLDLNGLSDMGRCMYGHLRRLANERDEYAEFLYEVSQEREFYKNQVEKRNHFITPPPNLERQHLANELTQCHHQIEDMENELEEKCRQLTDLKDNMRGIETSLVKLRSENYRMTEELRGTRMNRDELEVLREQASMSERFENEVFHLKQKIVELDFYKTRVEELREDNNALIEARAKLEEKLEKSHKRESTVIDDLVKCQIQLEDLATDKEKDQKKIEGLMEDTRRLEYEKRQIVKQAKADRERGKKELEQANRGCSISEELKNQTVSERNLELELENDKLKHELEQVKEKAAHEMKWKVKEVYREKQVLERTIEKITEEVTLEKTNCKKLENKVREISLQNERLEEEMDILKDSHEHHVEGLETQIEDLRATVEELRKRNEKSSQERLRLIEQENLQMFRSVADLSSQLTRVKYSNRFLRKSCDKLKDDVDKNVVFGNDNDKLRRENYDLKRGQASSRLAVEISAELEKKNLTIEIENRKLKKLVNILKTTLTQVDPLNRITYHYITSL
ncbi:protein Daple-like [Lineus longissimus]|uniref:protein Daple-like n=1 Tax=Lineus longissimus TaxID=88925 RepID=UPI002B4CCD01